MDNQSALKENVLIDNKAINLDFLENILDGIDYPVFVKDIDHKYVVINKSFADLVEMPENEIIGKTEFDLFDEKSAKYYCEKDNLLFEKRENIEYEEHFVSPSGKKSIISVRKKIIYTKENIPFLLAIVQDVTDLKDYEQSLKKSEAKLKTIFNNSLQAFVLLNTKFEIEWYNNSFKRIFGYRKKVPIGASIFRFIPKKDWADYRQYFEYALQGNNNFIEKKIRYEQKKEYWFEIHINPVINDKNEITGLFMNTVDINNHKKYGDALEQVINSAERAYEIIEQKNKNITDSILYAKEIQQAFFPSEEMVQIFYPDSFILYLTKDIVSGDFPWISSRNRKDYVAAVDCTGHGVPGALMSILGNALLNQAIHEHKVEKPAEILEDIYKEIENIGKATENKKFDAGMDIALCCIDYPNKKLQFSGAFRPLLVIRDQEIIEIKGDLKKICFDPLHHEMLSNFTNHEMEIQKGDTIYLFSDGYVDQMGGAKRKKFLTTRFRKLLISIQNEPLDEQKKILMKRFNEWKGNLTQIDDVLVIGIKI